jgi:transposase, IS30 family
MKAGFNRTDMAKEGGVHKSTISRELRRNSGQRGYRAKQAQTMAAARQQSRASATRIASATWTLVEERLRHQWSSEQTPPVEFRTDATSGVPNRFPVG